MIQLSEHQLLAFHRVVNVLSNAEIDFIISGGFAANLYGSTRSLADIDISIMDADIKSLKRLFSDYIVEDCSEENYRDDIWDLPLIVLHVNGQEFDIFPVDKLRFYNISEKRWDSINHANPSRMTFDGVEFKVLSFEELIRYKKAIGHAIDMDDSQSLALYDNKPWTVQAGQTRVIYKIQPDKVSVNS
ncbi:MAG: hypothetical protein MUO31_15035 [Thermodesulfovibrionales bacterium]|nr:hypothetical protein [Thermodesulfovibrionales bacterium]